MRFYIQFLVLILLSIRCLATFAKPAEVSIELGKRFSEKAAACAKTNGWKVSVAIVDQGGNLLFFRRDDGAMIGSIETAIAKARSANSWQRPTSAWADLMKQGRNDLLTLKDFVAIAGGLPILLEGKHQGAIGVSGAKGPEDEKCALAGLAN